MLSLRVRASSTFKSGAPTANAPATTELITVPYIPTPTASGVSTSASPSVLTRSRRTQYELNKQRTIAKIRSAARRPHVSIEKNTNDNIVIDFSAASFVPFKCVAENFFGNATHTLDKTGRTVTTTLRKTVKRVLKYTISLYHTTSRVLVNGPNTTIFWADFRHLLERADLYNADTIEALDKVNRLLSEASQASRYASASPSPHSDSRSPTDDCSRLLPVTQDATIQPPKLLSSTHPSSPPRLPPVTHLAVEAETQHQNSPLRPPNDNFLSPPLPLPLPNVQSEAFCQASTPPHCPPPPQTRDKPPPATDDSCLTCTTHPAPSNTPSQPEEEALITSSLSPLPSQPESHDFSHARTENNSTLPTGGSSHFKEGLLQISPQTVLPPIAFSDGATGIIPTTSHTNSASCQMPSALQSDLTVCDSANGDTGNTLSTSDTDNARCEVLSVLPSDVNVLDSANALQLLHADILDTKTQLTNRFKTHSTDVVMSIHDILSRLEKIQQDITSLQTTVRCLADKQKSSRQTQGCLCKCQQTSSQPLPDSNTKMNTGNNSAMQRTDTASNDYTPANKSTTAPPSTLLHNRFSHEDEVSSPLHNAAANFTGTTSSNKITAEPHGWSRPNSGGKLIPINAEHLILGCSLLRSLRRRKLCPRGSVHIRSMQNYKVADLTKTLKTTTTTHLTTKSVSFLVSGNETHNATQTQQEYDTLTSVASNIFPEAKIRFIALPFHKHSADHFNRCNAAMEHVAKKRQNVHYVTICSSNNTSYTTDGKQLTTDSNIRLAKVIKTFLQLSSPTTKPPQPEAREHTTQKLSALLPTPTFPPVQTHTTEQRRRTLLPTPKSHPPTEIPSLHALPLNTTSMTNQNPVNYRHVHTTPHDRANVPPTREVSHGNSLSLRSAHPPPPRSAYPPPTKSAHQPTPRSAHQPTPRSAHHPPPRSAHQPTLRSAHQPSPRSAHQPLPRSAHQPPPRSLHLHQTQENRTSTDHHAFPQTFTKAHHGNIPYSMFPPEMAPFGNNVFLSPYEYALPHFSYFRSLPPLPHINWRHPNTHPAYMMS